ncbi:MAG: hypothetical protein LBL76_01395 [Treponema sp.]|nr:hypothetical protein [Treponema sp.]
MKQVLENIFIYLGLVFRPRMLVRIARGYLAVSGQIVEASKMATEILQTLHDR